MSPQGLARGLLRTALSARRSLRRGQLDDWMDGAARRWALDSRSPGGIVTVGGDSIAAALPPALLSVAPDRVAIRGIPGATIAEFRARLPEALTPEPALLAIQVGTNDLLRATPPEPIAADHDELLDACRAARPDARLLVMALPPIASWRADPAALRAVNATLRKLSAAHDATFLDPLAGASRDAIQRDGVHLTARGYELMARAINDAAGPAASGHA